jgi:hypothetical protein
VFSSDKVVGVYGLDNVHWSFSYANDGVVEQGMPVFEMRSSLACRRFYPEDKFKRYAVNMYHNNIMPKVLIEKLNNYKEKGHYEESFEDRIKDELETSRSLIKKNLRIDTKLLSWPWGEYLDKGIEIAQSLGFEFCFTTKKSAFLGDDFCKIGRIKSPEDRVRFLRKVLTNANSFFAKLYSRAH